MISKKRVVLIPDRLSEISIERKIFGEDVEIICPVATNTNQIDLSVWKRVNIILAWHELTYSSEIIENLDSCVAIVRVGAGYDNVDLEAAKNKGILVCNIPDYGTNDVADHAFAFILNLCRGINSYNEKVHSEGLWSWDSIGELRRLTGRKLGIIGMGRIGKAVALRAKSFGMSVLFYDPYVNKGLDKSLQISQIFEFDEIMKTSDIISLHCPLTDETRNLINKKSLKQMKEGAILINTARGEIVNFDDLYISLKENAIKAVGLDVLPFEPPNFDHPLLSAWKSNESWIKGRMLLTPHSAFYNNESYKELRIKAAEEALRILDGGAPLNPIN